jgi:serine/threonine-protein kinase
MLEDDRDRARGDQVASQPTIAVGPPLYDAPIQLDLVASNRYRLGHRVGRGGMGEVLLAFDEQLGREVAVKRIRDADPTPDQLGRFVREARVQGWLEHPAVVPVHDIAVDAAGRPFFVMKRLAGTEMSELLDRLRTGGAGDPVATRRRLLRAFADVCLALEFAHSRGVVHRDLKPANVMLGDFGEVYVLDWGVARAARADDPTAHRAGAGAGAGAAAAPAASDGRAASGETHVGTVLGTPAYMAPEQLAGERVGPAADIYALGCILYEIAAGEPLHQAPRSVADALRAVVARPSAVRPDCPPELDAICARATAADPAARHGSARELGAAVQAYLDGDRDVAARIALARVHVAEARTAFDRGGEADRRDAMRAAGRALALDPTAADAAALVTRLMLEPPAATPREVDDRLEAIDIETGRTQGRLGAIAMTGYLGFVPLLVWTGVRDVAMVIAFAVATVVAAGQIYLMTRKDRIPTGAIYLSAVISAVLIAVVCRLVGPFVIAPTLVLTTLMAYAVHPRFGDIRIVAVILTAGVAVPWLAEAAGAIAPTYRFADGAIVLSSPSIAFAPGPLQLAFVLLLALLVPTVAVLLRSMANRQRDATRRIELQAWRLRQLVPVAPSRDAASR